MLLLRGACSCRCQCSSGSFIGPAVVLLGVELVQATLAGAKTKSQANGSHELSLLTPTLATSLGLAVALSVALHDGFP